MKYPQIKRLKQVVCIDLLPCGRNILCKTANERACPCAWLHSKHYTTVHHPPERYWRKLNHAPGAGMRWLSTSMCKNFPASTICWVVFIVSPLLVAVVLMFKQTSSASLNISFSPSHDNTLSIDKRAKKNTLLMRRLIHKYTHLYKIRRR